MIFYIHGLNSSANSEKLKKLQAFFKAEMVVGLEYDSRELDDYDKVWFLENYYGEVKTM